MEIMTHTENGALNASMQGKFTFSDNAAFRDVLQRIGANDVKQVIFNMERLSFVDSAALGMLLLARDEADKHKKQLLLHGVNGQVRRVFEMARFGQFFKF